MRIYLENNPAKFHPNPIWNDGDLGFFDDDSQEEEEWEEEEQESCAIAKTTARCALYIAALKILESPWLRPRPLVSKIFMAFCLEWACECSGQIWSS